MSGTKDQKSSSSNYGCASSSSDTRGPKDSVCRTQGSTTPSTKFKMLKVIPDKRSNAEISREMKRLQAEMHKLQLQVGANEKEFEKPAEVQTDTEFEQIEYENVDDEQEAVRGGMTAEEAHKFMPDA